VIAVLFARPDSVYKTLPGCDVYDINRDARTFKDSIPVVAHPPCRAWGRLRQFAKPRHDEKDLALFAIAAVRRNGGVLEHPARSSLWPQACLPLPGHGLDQYGGFTLPIDQIWFGHRAIKSTWLYIVGMKPTDVPPCSFSFSHPTATVECMGRAEREHTPKNLAVYLAQIASGASIA